MKKKGEEKEVGENEKRRFRKEMKKGWGKSIVEEEENRS